MSAVKPGSRGQNSGAIVATKLHVPGPRPGVVRRDRLIGRVNAAQPPVLTLVSAPAGFGKTTLLAACARADDRRVAWVSLDSADNDPSRFWLHVNAAVTAAVDHGGSATVAASDGSDVVVALVNELADLDQDLALVLDDYHAIESPQIHDAVSFLVEHLPSSTRLLIGTRADPPLPLARLRARGDLTEIRAADLRFTAAEADAYLNGSMTLGLTGGDVARLDARTEGWIAALQLAALSLQGRDDQTSFIDTFSGDDRFVVDYLAEEVLDRQSDEVRSFLLMTSILGRFTGDLCDAVTASSGGRAVLERLERANLFVVGLDDQRRWYRYHHLFADVLQARLLDERPDTIDELHRRASAWYASHGETADAVEHALLGHDSGSATRLIELAAPEMRQSRQEATLRRWLESLPPDVFADRPVLSITLVGARMSTGDATGVEPLVVRVEQQLAEGDRSALIVFDEDEYRRLPAQTVVYRAALALLAGDTEATIAHARRAEALAGPGDHLQLGAAAALTGLASWAGGDLDDAQRCYAASIHELRAAGHISDVLGCSLALADLQIAQGQLGAAIATYDSALQLAAEHRVVRGTADMHVGTAMVLIEQNRLDEAAGHLDTATSLGEHAGLPQNAYRSRVAAAELAAAGGDLDEAGRLLDEARPLYATDFSPPTHPVAARSARIDLRRGDLAAARRWVVDAGVGADDPVSYVGEYALVTLARTLVATRQLERDHSAGEDAVALLERLLDTAETANRAGSVIEILAVLAAAHHSRGDRNAAASAIGRALTLAALNGHVRAFLDTVPALESVLRSVSLEGAAERHRDRVLAVSTATPHATPARLVVDLSSRELDVLRLLRSELSGPDIAREMHVSLNTLRTHTKSIYTKLGASNRREALRIAAEHGL